MRAYVADLVSIVTPAYRASTFVGDAIRGAIGQTYPNWEMLIVDDCSPDDIASAVGAVASQDDRVQLILAPRNGGPALARNLALERAKGRYVAFCDADDYWLPAKLECQLSLMAQNDAPLSYTQYRRISEDGSQTGRLISVPDKLTYRQLLGNTGIATSSVILDRRVVGEVRMSKTFYDDFVLWLQILRQGHTAWGLREDLLRYRVVEGSWSRKKSRSASMVWRTYRDIEHLSLPESCWYLANYALRAYRKYRSF